RRHILVVEPVCTQLGFELLTTLVERVRHVLEEHQPEDDVLVLGRIHGTAQFVGGLPQCVLQFLHGRRRRDRRPLPRWHLQPSSGSDPLCAVTDRTPRVTPSIIVSVKSFNLSSRSLVSRRRASRSSRSATTSSICSS